jgi:protein-disulfide isomerase
MYADFMEDEKMTSEAKIILGTGLTTVVIVIIAVFFLSSSDSSKTLAENVDTNILMQNLNHKIASDSAKVTIVEFADFQCPACGAAHPVLDKILEDYPGRVNFIYRHFPLPLHSYAIPAIRAAEAAGEQGKFWEMHDMLYERQSEWSGSNKPFEIFLNFANELKLDIDSFTKSANSSKFDSSIQKDKSDAQALGVNSTPTIFINNKKLSASPSYQVLKEIIEKESQNK